MTVAKSQTGELLLAGGSVESFDTNLARDGGSGLANALALGPAEVISEIDDVGQTGPETGNRRPQAESLAAAYLEFDLAREIAQLRSEPKWLTGQSAKTLVKYDDFRVVLMALRAHARVPTHQTEGRISLQTIRGHIQVRASGRTFDLPVGSLLALDRRLPHDVEALEESVLLLTIAWPTRDTIVPAHRR